jgi:release factor glutamine methyltransferase
VWQDPRVPHRDVAGILAAHGFVAAEEEAQELLAAGGDLDALLDRRLAGEPLAWIVGSAPFCDLRVRVDPGVYVPRPQTEVLARRAAERLPDGGVAIDLCTGSGALAAWLSACRPGARVVAADVDERAVACAAANGVEAYAGDLFAPLPGDLAGRADVVVAVAPYVPRPQLGLLQRDTFAFEAALAYDGGEDGLDLVRRIVADAPRWLRAGGALLLEVGADQVAALEGDLRAAGFATVTPLVDEDGDVRGVEAS